MADISKIALENTVYNVKDTTARQSIQNLKIPKNIVDGNTTGALRGIGAKTNYTMGNYAVAEGEDTTASGDRAHAEGYLTVASGNIAHAEGYNTTAGGPYSHAEGAVTAAEGNSSHAEGHQAVASGYVSHAEGHATVAEGQMSHAQGNCTRTYGKYGSFAAGNLSVASTNKNVFRVLSGDTATKTIVVDTSVASWIATELAKLEVGKQVEYFDSSYINGNVKTYTIAAVNTEDNSITVEENISKIVAKDFFVYLDSKNSSNYPSTAIGKGALALGNDSFAEGNYTTASGSSAHAEGYYTTASGNYSHAEGNYTTASGSSAHAEGYYTTASGNYSHAEEYYTIANSYQHAQGKYNVNTTGGAYNTTTGTAFLIGNGTSNTARSNCFRVQYDGKTFAKGAYSSSGADYAELFEWEDGNPQKEDRRGLFVALKGTKIAIAQSPDQYILGIVSANPAVLGNNHSETWKDMYLTDVWGNVITERKTIPAEVETVTHMELEEQEDGTVIEKEVTEEILIAEEREVDAPILNPNYHPEEEYIPRHERKEWGTVGMMGQLLIYDDGSCQAGGYCVPGANGKATAAAKGYYVMERVEEDKIRVLFR